MEKQRAEAYLEWERTHETHSEEETTSVAKIKHFQNSGIPPKVSVIQGTSPKEKQLPFGYNSELCDILTCPSPSSQFHSSLEN